MKINWKLLLICLAIPLGVGVLAALLTGGSMDTFEILRKPPLSPPGWLFPVAWTLLYGAMGAASYLVLTSSAPQRVISPAIRAYGGQLALNFLWPILFFRFEMYWIAFIWLCALWLLILITMLRFFRISRSAGYLFLPYLAWVTFAGYLNFGIAWLN